VLLIDERPEEVTDMQRSVKGEVISSTFDEPASRHVQVAEMVTRKPSASSRPSATWSSCLIRSRVSAAPTTPWCRSSGKVLTGGVDATRFSAPSASSAPRAHRGGGSLTIIATALIDTGSRMTK